MEGGSGSQQEGGSCMPCAIDEPLLPSSPLSPSELPSDSLEDTPNVDTVHASDDEEV